jgi:dipeptidyl aminopeptidase/acylaminoacyl peptidase
MSKVKAQIFTHLLYRHWDHFTGAKRTHLFLATVATGALRDLTPNDPHDVPPFSLEGGGCGCAFAPDSKELAFTENLDAEPAISTNTDIFTLDLTNPAAKPVKVSTALGGDFNPAYSPDGKYLAWRSQERAGYESDKFRLMLYDRAAKTIKDLLPKYDNWVEEFAWATDSKKIYLSAGEKGESPIFVATLDGLFYKTVTILYDDKIGTFSSLLPLANNFGGLLATKMTIGSPSEVVRFGLMPDIGVHYPQGKDGPGFHYINLEFKDIPVTHLNDALLAQLDLPKLEDFWFMSTDKN